MTTDTRCSDCPARWPFPKSAEDTMNPPPTPGLSFEEKLDELLSMAPDCGGPDFAEAKARLVAHVDRLQLTARRTEDRVIELREELERAAAWYEKSEKDRNAERQRADGLADEVERQVLSAERERQRAEGLRVELDEWIRNHGDGKP